MPEELRNYEEAFHRFQCSRIASYELYCANIYTLKLSEKLKTIFEEENPLINHTLYFLIKEEDCKQLLLTKNPEIKEAIEIFLKYSPELVKEESLLLDRITSFPFCNTVIKILQNNGIKINKTYMKGYSGLCLLDENEIRINPNLSHEEQKETLLHELNHLFYQLPILEKNILVERIVEQQTILQLKDKEIMLTLEDLLNSI